MHLNYRILERFGTTDDRLRQLFTAKRTAPASGVLESAPAKKSDNDLDCDMRQKIEDLIESRLSEAMTQNLNTSHLYAAVDLAWDSSTITKTHIPLVMYAQGRIDASKCVARLRELKCDESYIKRDENNKETVDIPRLAETSINIVRSVITRRVAAQSARFTNLYPFFKYEPRGTADTAKLVSDLHSQIQDIAADNYGYREQQVQWIRDMLLYPHAMVFPACRWDRDISYVFEAEEFSPEFEVDPSKDPKIKSVVKREGVPLIMPHSSRIFGDPMYPLTSINTDSGCEYFGFWDATRYGNIANNPDFFNRDEISFGVGTATMFHQHASYFSQYYSTINPPVGKDDIAGQNDARTQLGKYNASMHDSSAFITNLYWKVKPNQWRMGNYPLPVWLHLVVANCRTVIAAEIMPDCPGAVFSYNESSQRSANLSMAHELMPFQDTLSNLHTQLLECIRQDLFSLAILNIDAFPTDNPEAVKALESFRAAMKSQTFYTGTSAIEVSLTKLRDLNIDLDKVFKVVRQEKNQNLSAVITAIAQTIQMAERVMALSPQEQAQMSPRETSATEVQIVAGTTENIYQFISDSVDAGRAAIKRYLCNAFMSFGENKFMLPVVTRYSRKTITDAGITIETESGDELGGKEIPSTFMVSGFKRSLSVPLIFSSRDGSDRSSNIQVAQTLTTLLGNVLIQPAAAAMVTRDQFAAVLNSIIRQSGAGADIVIEPPPGTGGMPLLSPQVQPIQGVPEEPVTAQFPTS